MFLLYCGNRKRHKNIINLIKAFQEVKKEFADLWAKNILEVLNGLISD
jgi:hypothetical protein